MVSSIGPGFKPGSGSVRITVDGLDEWIGRVGLAGPNLIKGMSGLRTQFFIKMRQYAEQNFRESIENPEASATISGRAYGVERGRQTGKFTFGPARSSATFVGVQRDEKGGAIQFAGYPNVERADRRTEKIWRALEYQGLRRHVRPRRFAFMGTRSPSLTQAMNAWSQRRIEGPFFTPLPSGQRRFGGRTPAVGPLSPHLVQAKNPLRPKFFIERAFEQTLRDLRPRYQDLPFEAIFPERTRAF